MGCGLPLRIAFRYLFAKKSHRAINAISLVAACGIAIVSTALVCILSVYNGFECLVGQLTSQLDPQLRIEASYGKSFHDNDTLRQLLAQMPEVEAVSATLEETVLIVSGGRQLPARMKGVDSYYQQVCNIDSILYRGSYILDDDIADYTLMGAGLAVQASTRAGAIRPLFFYCPKREGNINLLHPDDAFTEKQVFCSGVFAVQQANYDDNLCITSIQTARFLLQDSLLCSAYEIKLSSHAKEKQVQALLEEAIAKNGLSFRILNRHQQQADNYRIVQMEKWITFLLILFILLITSFNIIGALSMLIIDKEPELNTLRALGATDKQIKQIFACEGMLISCIGTLSGILLGVGLCLLQQEFGIIGLGDGTGMFVVDSYPVRLHLSDVFLCLAMTLVTSSATALGFLHHSFHKSRT
ncbi:MAG: FtsX-like permease family protein [Bacteroidales bacterium]|nr:FtsX-like permease family protein [Bacteroidales bacterium]